MPISNKQQKRQRQDDYVLYQLDTLLSGTNNPEAILLHALMAFTMYKEFRHDRVDRYGEALDKQDSINLKDAILASDNMIVLHGGSYLGFDINVHNLKGTEGYRWSGYNKWPTDIDLLGIETADPNPLFAELAKFHAAHGGTKIVRLGIGSPDYKIPLDHQKASKNLATAVMVFNITPEVVKKLGSRTGKLITHKEHWERLWSWIGEDGKFRPEIVKSIADDYQARIAVSPRMSSDPLTEEIIRCDGGNLPVLIRVDCRMEVPFPLLKPRGQFMTEEGIPGLYGCFDKENRVLELVNKLLSLVTGKTHQDRISQSIFDFGLRAEAFREEIKIMPDEWKKKFFTILESLAILHLPAHPAFWKQRQLGEGLIVPLNFEELGSDVVAKKFVASHGNKYFIESDGNKLPRELMDMTYQGFVAYLTAVHAGLSKKLDQPEYKEYLDEAKTGKVSAGTVKGLLGGIWHFAGEHIIPVNDSSKVNDKSLDAWIDYCCGRLNANIKFAKELSDKQRNVPGHKKSE